MKKNRLILVTLILLPQFLFPLFSFGQEQTVKGVVTDETNSPLIGVNVLVEGTSTGTTTNLNGEYQLKANPSSTLLFSFVGYISESVVVGDQEVINVTLLPSLTELGDVVVIGYGTQARQNLTGSVSKIEESQLESKPVSSIESALQGQVSGVSVTNTGSPGVAPTVRIRGIGSISYASGPLYVVDGVPVENLNNFDVKDIASVSILKDAASAAIYGSRAANGVILVTTKTGQASGKLKLTIDASYGTQNAWKKLDLLNRDEYLQYGTELLTNAGDALPPRFSNMNEPIYPGASQTFAQTETDWQDAMFRSAPIAQLNVSLSGGNEKNRLYTSYGRFSQEGIMLGSDFNRHSFRINSDNKLNDFITIGENINAAYSDMSNLRVSGGRTIVKHMLNQVPYIPVYNPTNLGGFGGPTTADGSDAENPVRLATFDQDKTRVVNLLGNVYAELRFTNWLKFRSSVGMDYTDNRHIIQLPIYSTGYNTRSDNELTDNRFTFFSPVFTNQLSFNHNFGKHLVDGVLVAEQQQSKWFYLNTSGKQSNNDIDQLRGSTTQAIDGYQDKTVLLSYAGRLNYAYDNKYLLNFSIRRDGSSVFAPGKKWGYFPGGSVGWIVSKEAFMQSVDFISNLKLRASYGTLGFNALGAYPWQANVSTNTTAVFNNDYQNNPGAYYDKLENRELEWEITTMSNYGIDLSLLNNSITFSAEYFLRQTDNLIVDNPLPTSMGYAVNPPTNIGSMKNWGYEFTAGYNKNLGEFRFSVEGNISFVNNEVLKLSTGQPNIDMGGVTSDYGGGTITRTEAGYPIQGFYGYVVDGIFQSDAEVHALDPDPANKVFYQSENTKAGDLKFKDLDGNGIIDDNDRTYIGNYLPDFSYGLNLNGSYKGFTLSLLLQGVQGNDIYNGTKVLTQGMARLFNADKAVLDAWTPQNTNTDIPRAVNGDPNQNSRTSDRFVEDGSYLRVKNLTLNYSLPKQIISSVFKEAVTGINIYATAQNLITITNYTGYDPEIGASNNYSGTNARLLQGVDFGFYPQPRTLLIGLNLTF